VAALLKQLLEVRLLLVKQPLDLVILHKLQFNKPSIWVDLELLVLLVPLVPLVLLVDMAFLALLVLQALLVHKVLKVFRVFRVFRDLKGLKAHKEKLELGGQVLLLDYFQALSGWVV
jgi:hypothetical protein